MFAQGAAATPVHLLDAMTKHGMENNLRDITVTHMHTEGPASYCKPECKDVFRSKSLFMGGNVRAAVADGRGDAVPIFLHEIPLLFRRKLIQPDVAIVSVSPPDNHGYCTLGTSVDCVRAALENSKVIIAQVNKQMPRTFGDGIIHQSHFDYAVNVDIPLPEHGGHAMSDVETKIGQLIAENLVEDGATLQMGIGNIPDAVLNALHNHKDLGIHSEMFAGGVVDLVRKGCVTNDKKTFHRGRIVGSFLIGTKKLYDFVDNNPFIGKRDRDCCRRVVGKEGYDIRFCIVHRTYRNVGDQLRQQCWHYLAQPQDDGHQLGHRGRSHRAGVCGFDRHTHVLRLRRTGRLYPRCGRRIRWQGQTNHCATVRHEQGPE